MPNPTRDPVARLEEWARFYHAHKDTPRSLGQQMAFTNLMMDGLMELMALVIAELRQKQENTLIYTPRGVRVEFDHGRRVGSR